MGWLEKSVPALLIVVAALILGAEYFALPWLTAILLVGVGLVAVLGGIRAIRSGEVFEGRSRWGGPRFVKRYSGTSARLLGFLLLLVGPVVIVLGAMEASNPGRAGGFLVGLTGSPQGWALILAVTGLMVTVMGVARFLAGSAMAPGVYHRHVELGLRAGGALAAAIGLLMLSLAAGLLVVPGLPQALADLSRGVFAQVVAIVERWGR